jgi:hypothetical protein
MKRTSADARHGLTTSLGHAAMSSGLVPDERCDACPGLAVVVVVVASGGELVLCGNHARRFASPLLEAGATIVGDYSHADGLRSAVDIRVALTAEGDVGDAPGRGRAVRTGRWQRFLNLFRKA